MPLVIFIMLSIGIRNGLKIAGMVVLGFFLLYGGWVARNLHTLGRTGDNGLVIATLLHGMYPDFMYDNNPNSYGSPYRFDPQVAEFSRSLKTILGEIRRRFSEEPLAHIKWYLIGKPISFWSWNEVQGSGDVFVFPVEQSPYWDSPVFMATHAFMEFIHWPLVLLGLAGFFFAWWLPTKRMIDGQSLFAVRVMALLLGYFTLLHMVGTPLPRYATPVRPILFGVAMLPISLWLSRTKTAIQTSSHQGVSKRRRKRRSSRS